LLTAEAKALKPTHPEITEAAVIAIAHPQWDERPLVVAVRRKGQGSRREISWPFCEGKIAKWWMPDDALFIDELPHGASGKVLKDQIARAIRKPRSRLDKPDQNAVSLERAKGIEPSYAAWENDSFTTNVALTTHLTDCICKRM